jgi:tectonin beta-propeller repeat-containing protein 1
MHFLFSKNRLLCQDVLFILLQVETGPSGVVWALGYDGTAWAYTGGWGGAHFKLTADVHPVQDRKYFYIYENQRWNPLTGFTAHGLPTDRWS